MKDNCKKHSLPLRALYICRSCRDVAQRRRIIVTPKAAEDGFTLVELLIVIAVIALLLAILLPALGKAKSTAKRVKCAGNLKQIDLAMHLYLAGNNDTYPCAEDPVSTKPPYWLWMGRGWRSYIKPYLGGNIDVNNPSVLLCPGDRTEAAKYQLTSYAYSMAFYHSPEQIDDMNNVENTYIHTNESPSSVPQRSCDVANPAGKILIGEWLSNHSPVEKDYGWWCWEGRRNYLFADGHVLYLKARQIREARDRYPDANLTFKGIKGIDWPN